MKIGTDIEEINRFEKINLESFCNKYFTHAEKEYSLKKGVQTVAGIYSCKEAVLKAFGIGICRGVNLNEISILHDENGKPYLEKNHTLTTLLNKYGLSGADISISHTKQIVQSVCILF